MDMNEFAGSKFVRLDDIRAKPIVGKIKSIKMGQYGKPIATLEDDRMVSFNVTSIRTMIHGLGSSDSRDWIGAEIEVRVGMTPFEGQDRESILIRPRSTQAKVPPKPRPERATEMDDEIPF